MYTADDVLRKAHTVGRLMFGRAAGMWMQDLQFTHAMAALRQRYYDDQKYVRLKRNLQIEGPPAAKKSTTSKFFFKEVAGVTEATAPSPPKPTPSALAHARELFDKGEMTSEVWEDVGPKLITITGSTSWASLRGSFTNESEIAPTLLTGADYVYATELYQLIGANVTDIIDNAMNLNTATEEGQVVISLNKGVTHNKSQAAEGRRAAARWGMQYHPELGRIDYHTPATFVTCTTPLASRDKDIANKLDELGYTSRFHRSVYAVGAEGELFDAKQRRVYGPIPEVYSLERFNAMMWLTDFKEVPAPPPHLLEKMDEVVYDYIEEAWRRHGIKPHNFVNDREKNDYLRAFTFSAMCREVSPTKHECRISYNEEDRAFAERYAISDLMARLGGAASRESHGDKKDTKALRSLVQFGRDSLNGNGVPPFTLDELHEAMDKDWATVSHCFKNRWVSPTGVHREVKLDPSVEAMCI